MALRIAINGFGRIGRNVLRSAKQAGNTEIWTPNCWMGADYDRPKPAG